MTSPGAIGYGAAELSAIAFCVAEARAAGMSLVNAMRLALVISFAVANVPAMFESGVAWSTTTTTEAGDVATKLQDALDKAKDGWSADDYDALEAKLKEVLKELQTVQNSCGMIGGAMFAVGAAFVAYWAYAALVVGTALALALVTLAASATPAGPAVRVSAETIVGVLTSTIDAFTAKLAAIAAAVGTLFVGLTGAALGGIIFTPVADTTQQLTQLKIDWTPPNRWISPKKEDPEPYQQTP